MGAGARGTTTPPVTVPPPLKPLLPARIPEHPVPMVSVPASVTEAVSVKSLPHPSVTVVPTVMLMLARIFPSNVEPEPRVAEPEVVSSTQNMPAPAPVLITLTTELLAVVIAVPIWKMKTALVFWASRVSAVQLSRVENL
jgi:hypothetical protein